MEMKSASVMSKNFFNRKCYRFVNLNRSGILVNPIHTQIESLVRKNNAVCSTGSVRFLLGVCGFGAGSVQVLFRFVLFLQTA
jgi:hypothetical protein